MSSFTTRVELHNASESDYESLHQSMEGEGFSRFIQSSEGKWYHLPPAEYNRDAAMTIEAVRESAKRAAATTGRSCSVLVSEATGRAWSGLREVAASVVR
jgi:hypothetical protein